MNRSKLGVSACLLGVNCKYNGKNNLDFSIVNYLKGKELVLLCPEVMAGLKTPRLSNEIQRDGSVVNINHEDVTEIFNLGKELTLQKLKQNKCLEVILKDGSPSCGYSCIYDGSFTNKKIKGKGLTTLYLEENGIKVLEIN
ncbi:MAG: DUF523 domain-containing protein [Bacillota bacterium]